MKFEKAMYSVHKTLPGVLLVNWYSYFKQITSKFTENVVY